MSRTRKPSAQALAVLSVLAEQPKDWLYGLELAGKTGLKSGSLYPILIRLSERGLLEECWIEPSAPGRPPRHAYRIRPGGLRLLAEQQAEPAAIGKESFA